MNRNYEEGERTIHKSSDLSCQIIMTRECWVVHVVGLGELGSCFS
jgi:hypothetical protein